MVFEDRTLTYAALDAHANRLAHHLQSLGVGPETMVGLCVERSPEMVIGLLGILKAGGAYLPLDPNYPRERLAFMLADAGCPVLVTQSALLDRLPDDAAHRQIVRLDADWPAIARQPGTAPPLDLDPRHPAYVIYTSGSTGTPKGVVVEHRQIAASNASSIIASTRIVAGAAVPNCFCQSMRFRSLRLQEATLPLVSGAYTRRVIDDAIGSRRILSEPSVQQKVNCCSTLPPVVALIELVQDAAAHRTSEAVIVAR